MPEARMLKMTDDYARFSTNAQTAHAGRFSMPTWLCEWWEIWSNGQNRIYIVVTGAKKKEPLKGEWVNLTSGAEIVAARGSDLFAALKPGARIKVQAYRPGREPDEAHGTPA